MAETKEKLVKITIPRTPGKKNEEALFISINERNWQIKPGVEVEVPECVVALLHDRDVALDRREAYEAGLN